MDDHIRSAMQHDVITTSEPGERGSIQRGIDRINSLITPERILRRQHSPGAPLRRRIDRRTILALREGKRNPAPARVRQVTCAYFSGGQRRSGSITRSWLPI